MSRIALFLALLLAGAPAIAQTCPPQPVDEVARKTLHAELRAAPDEQSARTAMDGLWRIWRRAPDERAQELLDSGIERIHLYDFDMAISAFDALVEYCPGYAEGYNQRAFAYFLKQDYAAALGDLEHTLSISPQHIGALAGKGLTLMGLGRDREALRALEAAVTLHPYLKERGLIDVLRHKLGIKDL